MRRRNREWNGPVISANNNTLKLPKKINQPEGETTEVIDSGWRLTYKKN